MPVLKQNEYKLLLWGDKNNFITGLDPLGLQISSEATYTHLLSGITNLTNRIRYYGFYCWLLDYYAQHERNTDPYVQNCFIRRAELMLAIIMKTHEPDYTQVTGSQYAGIMVAASPEVYDLKTNADKSKERNTYWKFSSGAFGQYYAGAMKELGLITRNTSDNFICLGKESHTGVTGAQLAKAFEGSLPLAIKELFIHNIKGGILRQTDTVALYQYFALNKIPENKSEQQTYLQLLMAKDSAFQVIQEEQEEPEHRRNTILFVMNYLQSNQPFTDYRAFNIDAYQNKGLLQNQPQLTLQLWYYYQLNELWQFGATSMLWVVLKKLEDFNRIHLNQFLEILVDCIEEELNATHNINTETKVSEVLNQLEKEENELAKTIEKLVSKKDRKVQQVAGWSILLLLTIYKNNVTERETLRTLTTPRRLDRPNGVLDFFKLMDRYLEKPLVLFVKDFIINQIIYRHQLVAIRKTGSGSQSSLKFLLEENYLKLIAPFSPQFTSPRLNALLNILTDLRLIDKHKQLTAQGQEFLKNQQQ